jgi:hypothetical protein
MNRTWVYTKLVANTSLAALVSTRIWGSTTIKKVPEEKPFILYRSTGITDTVRGDDGVACRTETFMIFAEDKPGDYLQIDTMIGYIDATFNKVKDETAGVIRSTIVETSEDFRDEDLGTILRFVRIAVVYRV